MKFHNKKKSCDLTELDSHAWDHAIETDCLFGLFAYFLWFEIITIFNYWIYLDVEFNYTRLKNIPFYANVHNAHIYRMIIFTENL